jgi:myo-inositol-1(or 4)-monophosphatase
MTARDPQVESRIEAAHRAVLAQTEFMHREFGRVESRWKSDGTRVTGADIAISEGIFRELAAQFPGDQFFSEEFSEAGGPIPVTARFSWVLDPIDGTNNFALGIPQCAISLALVEAGEPVYGVVYDLSRRVLMHGGPGFGMHDGDRTTAVSDRTPSAETLVGFHSPSDKTLLPMAEGVLSQFKIRSLGSATLHLAYVAAGLLDASVDFNVKIWDLAAAIPLCRAAGASVHFLNGDQLPMRQFDLRMKRIVYVAGSEGMCARLREAMAPRAGPARQT